MDAQVALTLRELTNVMTKHGVTPISPAAGDLRRSDHASFWDESYPGVMLTDTSEFRYANYHCRGGPDVVLNLDPHFATQIVTITVAAAANSLGL